MNKIPKQIRAYVCKVENKKARTSASKEYFQLFVEGGSAYLFTTADLDKAEKRAKNNPEDVVPIKFVEPTPKIVEVPAKGIISKLFQGFFKQ